MNRNCLHAVPFICKHVSSKMRLGTVKYREKSQLQRGWPHGADARGTCEHLLGRLVRRLKKKRKFSIASETWTSWALEKTPAKQQASFVLQWHQPAQGYQPSFHSFRLYQEYQSNVYRGSINLTNNATGKHVENTDLLESYFPGPWSRDVHRLGSFLSLSEISSLRLVHETWIL